MTMCPQFDLRMIHDELTQVAVVATIHQSLRLIHRMHTLKTR